MEIPDNIIRFFIQYKGTLTFSFLTFFVLAEYFKEVTRKTHQFKYRVFLRIHRPIIIFVDLTILAVVVTMELSISDNLRSAIIAEIIGSGIIGAIIAFMIYRIAENRNSGIYQYETRLKFEKILQDMKQVIMEGNDTAVLNNSHEYFFSNSLINGFYRVCQQHSLDIRRCKFDLDGAPMKLAYDMANFYNLAVEARSVVQKIDDQIVQFARQYNLEKNVSIGFDAQVINYIRAKVCGYSDEKVKPWIHSFESIDKDKVSILLTQIKDLAHGNELKVQLIEMTQKIKIQVDEQIVI